MRLALWASSSAPDADFSAKLVDVAPNGHARNLCDGILRARYRDSYAEPCPLEPGMPTRMEVDLLVTSNRFLTDHQVRLEIAGSNCPRYDRYPNDGEEAGTAHAPPRNADGLSRRRPPHAPAAAGDPARTMSRG